MCVFVGSEEEESLKSSYGYATMDEEESLKSFYGYATMDDTAANVDSETKVDERHQNSPSEDSFVAQSQTSFKCSPMLRNKVKLYCQLSEVVAA